MSWTLVPTTGEPVVTWAGFDQPTILPRNITLPALLWDAHRLIACPLSAEVVVHLSAAPLHALVRRDRALEAMPGGGPAGQ